MARSHDPRHPLPAERGPKRTGPIGTILPGDDLEVARDIQRLWLEIDRLRRLHPGIDSTANVGDEWGVHSRGAAEGDVLTADGADGSIWLPPGAGAASGYDGRVTGIGNLVSYWRMGAASGNQPDTSGNAFGPMDLVKQVGSATASTYDIVGADAMVASGDDDGAWQSNRNQTLVDDGVGAGDYFLANDVGHSRWSFAALNSFSVSFFFKQRSGWSLPSGAIPIIGTDPGNHVSALFEGWSVLIQALPNPNIIFGRGGVGADQLVGPQVALDTWTHVVCTYDGATMRMYFDGSLVASLASTASNSARTQILVGGGRYNASSRGEIYGAVDEIAVYSAALTSAQVASLADGGTDPTVYGMASVGAAYSTTPTDQVVLANGTFTVTLYTAVGNAGRFIAIKNSGAGTITVGRTSAQTIDGTAASITLTAGQSRTLMSDGTGWRIISGYL
jgi:hypothetical protein